MPLVLSTKAEMLPNLCMECGEQCRRPKKFCDDTHRQFFGRETRIDARGAGIVAAARQRRGITPESLEWRRKLNVTQPF